VEAECKYNILCPFRYNKQWADAYWHSKTQTFTKHILYLMTRWALVADVWYLPPETLQSGQTSSQFANDVKAKISKQAKLKNLSWDGYFKVSYFSLFLNEDILTYSLFKMIRTLPLQKRSKNG
jgi:hypothetical protein